MVWENFHRLWTGEHSTLISTGLFFTFNLLFLTKPFSSSSLLSPRVLFGCDIYYFLDTLIHQHTNNAIDSIGFYAVLVLSLLDKLNGNWQAFWWRGGWVEYVLREVILNWISCNDFLQQKHLERCTSEGKQRRVSWENSIWLRPLRCDEVEQSSPPHLLAVNEMQTKIARHVEHRIMQRPATVNQQVTDGNSKIQSFPKQIKFIKFR